METDRLCHSCVHDELGFVVGETEPRWRCTKKRPEYEKRVRACLEYRPRGDEIQAERWEDDSVETLRRELARAHAAMHWCATVRAVIMSGMLRAHGEDAQRGLLNILAVAHATAEVWLSGARVTAEAVAHLLGWHAPHSALAVKEWWRPLQEGPHPSLITADGQPNIKVRSKEAL